MMAREVVRLDWVVELFRERWKFSGWWILLVAMWAEFWICNGLVSAFAEVEAGPVASEAPFLPS